jgi:hypothetical protein
VRIATAVKAGFFLSMRSAYFKSCKKVCIVRGPPEGLYVLYPGLVHQMTLVHLVNTAAASVVAKNLLVSVSFSLRMTSRSVNETLRDRLRGIGSGDVRELTIGFRQSS